MLGGVVRGIHRVFTEGVVGVAPSLSGAAARPVLDHRVHAVLPPAVGAALRGLHAVTVGLYQRLCARKILAQRIHEAHPARFRAQVDLRAQRRGDPKRAVFQRGVMGKLPHHIGIEAGGKSHALGPLAHVVPGALVFRGAAPGSAARIGGQVDRYAVGLALRRALQLIGPARGGSRVLHHDHQDVADVIALDELPLLVGERMGGASGLVKRLSAVGPSEGHARPGRDHLMGRVEHKSSDLLNRQPRGQVRGPLLRVQPPVLIGKELSRTFQILKQQSVLFQQLHTARFMPAQGFSPLLDKPADSFENGLFPIHSRQPPFLSLSLLRPNPRAGKIPRAGNYTVPCSRPHRCAGRPGSP